VSGYDVHLIERVSLLII